MHSTRVHSHRTPLVEQHAIRRLPIKIVRRPPIRVARVFHSASGVQQHHKSRATVVTQSNSDLSAGDTAFPENGAPSASLKGLASRLPTMEDTNQLQTLLAAAITAEDYVLAARVRDRLKQVTGGSAARIDWASLGVPEWLDDRAQRLGFKFPTEVQRRAAAVLMTGSDALIQSETGSGKTLAFLLPALARLDYPPDLYPEDLDGPQALIVVPTMELGVQICLLAYRLFGGNFSAGLPGDEANIFTYTGPRNIKVRGVLNKEEVVMAKSGASFLKAIHVVVGTPQALLDVINEPDAKPLLFDVKVLAIDEVDECFAQAPEAMKELLSRACAPVNSNELHVMPDPEGVNKPVQLKAQVIFVGATQRPHLLDDAIASGWLKDPVQVVVGSQERVPAAIKHRYIVCEPSRRLAVLASSLRADLANADPDEAPARVMLFTNTPEEAAAVADPLRTALWTEHRLAVLLPIKGGGLSISSGALAAASNDEGIPPTALASSSSMGAVLRSTGSLEGQQQQEEEEEENEGPSTSGYDPLRALLSFRDNKSTLLICTGAAARGLDLPAVSHVYNLGLPADYTQYLHRAGRAGRIGSTQGGTVTTIITQDELALLQAQAERIGATLSEGDASTLPGLMPQVMGPVDGKDAPAGEVDALRRGLEDLYNLM